MIPAFCTQHNWRKEAIASPENRIESCLLSFPSLKDPVAERHTAQIMILTSYDRFRKWQGQPWQQRDPDYYELKEKIATEAIAFVDKYYPGFKDSIEYYELATPLTVEYFVECDRGSIYGIPWVSERLDCQWLGSKTPIKNLYLTGADALGHGIVGAMMGGVQTAGILNGAVGFLKIMSAIAKQSAYKSGDNLSGGIEQIVSTIQHSNRGESRS